MRPWLILTEMTGRSHIVTEYTNSKIVYMTAVVKQEGIGNEESITIDIH